ncbi:MAG: winged helix-turn-helix transcriptional regulator [Chloroflexi bacterium]|nr:MAG: winged helix-turn-helix transcriptional regulator [Chloroflexota bacterium]TMG67461.1 MAG: winged helix-turn-helix transcriptional regulator [Chloroflexota bacterium]
MSRTAVLEVIAEPSRLRILQELMSPASVSELSSRTRLRQANLSNHLARLRAIGLVARRRHGRVAEYRLASLTVAHLVESVSTLIGPPKAAVRADLAEARTCYDHLAGRFGVALFDHLLEHNAIADSRRADGALELGPDASAVFRRLGVDLQGLRPSQRRLAYRCVDWTERRPHLGGLLGALLTDQFFASGYVRRRKGSRGLRVEPRAWHILAARPVERSRAKRVRS